MKDLSAKKEARLEKKKKKITALAEIMKLNDADRQKDQLLIAETNDEPPIKRSKMDQTSEKEILMGGGDVITTDEYTESKKIIKERSRNRTNPKFRSKLPGDSAMLEVDAEVRTPIFLNDIQQLIMSSLLGTSSPYPPLRWCSIEKSNSLVHSVVLVLEGLSLYHYQCYESSFTETSSIFSSNKFEVVMPTDSSGLLTALSSLPVTSEQRQQLNEKFGSVEAAKDDVQPLVNSVFPMTSVAETPTHPVHRTGEVFSRTKLLLSALQLVDESYPLPLQGELANRFKDFVMTKREYLPVTSESPMFGLDCEMCYTSAGCNEVTRISIVNENYESIYETLVLPKNKIVNYLTPYSGITAEMMTNVTKSLEEVQRDVQQLLPSDAILVGQSLNCDLMACKMMHPYIIDTSVIFNLSGIPRHKSKLQTLAREFLGEQIQSNPLGHDSIEDCATTMKLVKLKLSKGMCFGDAYLKSRAIASDKTEKECKRSTLLITSADDSKLKNFQTNGSKDLQLLQVTGNKCAVKKTCELAIQHNLTLTHLNLSAERLEASTVDKTMSSVDRWIAKVYEKVAVNGLMIVVFGGAPGTKSGVAMVKIKKHHQSTTAINSQ